MSPGQHRGDDDATEPTEDPSELLDRWQEHLARQPHREGSAPLTPRHVAQADDDATTSAPLPADHLDDHLADHNVAGREVLAALATTPPPPAAPVAAPAVTAPAAGEPRRRARPEPAPIGRTTDVEFAPRRGAQILTGFLVLAGVVATALGGVVAYDDPTTLTIGVAVALGVSTLAVWGVRAGSNQAHLAIRSGQLEVARGNQRDVIDLGSRFTRIETRGKPRSRGWRVLVERVGQDPLVIDSSMVDPREFTAALEAHRPATGSR